MALRDQPYIPLYVKDYLTDEKLNNCSAASQGVFIKIMCVLHKQEQYGCLLFKQKDKQNSSMCLNFAFQLSRQLAFDQETIFSALEELVEEGVLQIEGNILSQKRMVKDFMISQKRSEAAKIGGGNPNLFKQDADVLFKQGDKQNPVYANVNANANSTNKGVKKNFQKPTEAEVVQYFLDNGYKADAGTKAFRFYNDADWVDSKGNKVKNWKQKMQGVWFIPENKQADGERSAADMEKIYDLYREPGSTSRFVP